MSELVFLPGYLERLDAGGDILPLLDEQFGSAGDHERTLGRALAERAAALA